MYPHTRGGLMHRHMNRPSKKYKLLGKHTNMVLYVTKLLFLHFVVTLYQLLKKWKTLLLYYIYFIFKFTTLLKHCQDYRQAVMINLE
jgi:hypothetical protein